MKLERFAYYWVRLNEPDGSSWEVAQFIETKMESWDYWNNRPGVDAQPQNYWSMCGKAGLKRQVTTPGASNRWEIGPRVLPPGMPTADIEAEEARLP